MDSTHLPTPQLKPGARNSAWSFTCTITGPSVICCLAGGVSWKLNWERNKDRSQRSDRTVSLAVSCPLHTVLSSEPAVGLSGCLSLSEPRAG